MTTLTPTGALYSVLSTPLSAAQVPLYVGSSPEPIDGSGATHVVLRLSEQGGTSHASEGVYRPRVMVNVFSDHTRDAAGLVTTYDAERRALSVYDVVLRALNGRRWEGVVYHRRIGEPRFLPTSDEADAALLLSVVYELTLYGPAVEVGTP